MIFLISIFIVLSIIFLFFILSNNIKLFFGLLSAVLLFLSVGICIIQPVIHKPISLNIIDYLIKFNTDGSVTTIKQTTTTIMKEDNKQ